MMKDTTSIPAITVGLDLSDRYAYLVALDAQGEVTEEGRVRSTRAGLRNRFATMPRARIAIEVGPHSPWISRALEDLGHEVLVANPRKFRLIYENESKSDRIDATYLARVARLDKTLLSPIRHRGERAQADLALLRSRQALVRARTRLVNHVRGAVKAVGSRVPSCSAEAFFRRAAQHIPEPIKPALDPILEHIKALTTQIRQFEKQIEHMSRHKYPETRHLRQVRGVGPITCVAYVLTLEDPCRFKKSRAVGSYLGLRPRKNESGERDPQLRITKAGDEFLRSLLVGCAQYILGPFGEDCDLRRWGLRLAQRGGKRAKKQAVVAVARKLAILLHRLWRTGERYEPLRNAKPIRRERASA